MPVLTSEVKWMRAATMSDADANGGRMSNSQIVSGVKQNIFPHASQAQRAAGATQLRKFFIKNTNADGLAMVEPKIFVKLFTGGADAVVIHEGTQTDIQSDLTGAERVYGCGKLNGDTGTDEIEIEVLTEGEDLDYFHEGDLIIVFSVNPLNELEITQFEYVVIDPSATVTYVGDVATIPLQTPLQNSYEADNTRVASVIEADDIVGVVGDAVVTSSAGTFNDGSNPIIAHNDGAIEQNWTLSFSSGTAFAVSGDTVGSVGTGTVGSDFEPDNPLTSVPYYTIDHFAFGGTFIAGDTITFPTSPAAWPGWGHRIIPPGAAQFTNDRMRSAVDYESA